MKEILKGSGWRVKKFIDEGDSVYVAVIEKGEEEEEEEQEEEQQQQQQSSSNRAAATE